MECKILTIDDIKYPEKLRIIKKPPEKIYYIGNLDLLEKPIFAVIGTRHITEYGKKYGKIITTELAKKFVIASGMALGCDTIAHKSALSIGGETIAVLGGGFENIFPKQNKKLFNEIIENGGLVISEYTPQTTPDSKKFPERNRIVSGLSDGVLVIEAGYRSGTSITVGIAKEQGKRIYAIPGSLDNIYSIGVNKFIQEGAKLVTCASDITIDYPQIIEKEWKTYSKTLEIKEEYKKIYMLLEKEQMNLEEISEKIPEKTIRDIMNSLIMMEIEGLIVNDIGRGYKINDI